MNVKKLSNIFYILPFLLCSLLPVKDALAASVRDLVAEGNKAYNAGNFEEALESYDQAEADNETSPHIQFNRGNALYNLGKLDEAISAFEKSIQLTNDTEFIAQGKYNLGNTFFKKAQQQQIAPDKALAYYLASENSFKQAFETAPDMLKAARKIETTRLEIKNVRDLIKKIEKIKKDLEDLIKKQKALADKNKEINSEQNKSRKIEGQKKLAKKQESLQEKTEKLKDELNIIPNSEQGLEHMGEANSAQKKAADTLKKNKDQDSQKNLDIAHEELQKALDSLNNKTESEQEPKEGEKCDNPQQGSGEQKDQSESNNDETGDQKEQSPSESKQDGKEEKNIAPPDQTAKDILEREQQNRQQRQLKGAFGYQPVEKDW